MAEERIRHSFCRWCYPDVALEDLCIAAREMGISSIELVMPEDLALLNRHDLVCAMISFPLGTTPAGLQVGGIENAFNRLENHDTLLRIYEPHLRAAATGGARQVICFSGNRAGISDDEGMENCAIGLRRILPLAAELGISICMELLNSKVDHPDYQCDHSAWGVELCKRVDSPNFGLLYDIYHMQIMEGDVIRTIRENHPYFLHYHTGGCPGRNEIDDSQELSYPAIIRAIRDTGYDGFIGQEFLPTSATPFESLRRAVEICSF